jgi:hypothetical protein
MSFPPATEMFQFTGFASRPYGFRSGYSIARVGCPIRRSGDQRALASPPGFSQRATSFIASWRQGIHQMPLTKTLDRKNPSLAGTKPGVRSQEAGVRDQEEPGPIDCASMPSIAPNQATRSRMKTLS